MSEPDMNSFPELPAFLDLRGLTADERKRRMDWWKGRKLTAQGSGFKPPKTREEEATTKQLRKELEKQEVEKKAARIKALRERFHK